MLAIAILVAIIMALLLSIAGYCFFAKRKKKASDNAPAFYGKIWMINSLNWVDSDYYHWSVSFFFSYFVSYGLLQLCASGDDITTIDSLQLDYRTIQAATNDYSENNKIGRGGFGEVYKVLLVLSSGFYGHKKEKYLLI